ncbi:hypothetical protein C358_06946 [Cryptococcus neoformans MW-RSA852]|nr:hypothetical protein C358_06946 [Cryptococcus neoformans var. grubii MW-RSA852]
MTTLSLERERLAGDKARRDWEEQALEEHRRTERRMKEEEMECRQKEVSAKEGASIFEIARFVLPSVYFPENSPVRLYMVATRCRS